MAFSELIKKNDVLTVNPVGSGVDIHLTSHGSSWLWAAFAVFTVFAVCHAFIYGATSFKNNVAKKTLLLVPLFTNFVVGVAYFTYASNLGWAGNETEFKHVNTNEDIYVRQIFYAKYIGWFLAWPFSLLAITVATSTLSESLTSEPSKNFEGVISVFSNLVTKVLATEVFVLGLLIGTLIHSTYKWGYFTFALVGQIFAMCLVSVNVAKSFKSNNNSRIAGYVILLQLLVWLLYPICWGLSEGGNVIQPDSEAVFYGILDLITFSWIPTILTWTNITLIDDEFFHKLVPFRHHSSISEKLGETPRHSGDTAVPQETQPQPEEV